MSGRVMKKSTFLQEQAVSTTKALPKVIINEKQGIVSILGSDCERTRGGAASLSLRRTLSADMSSKKWLAQNGFHPIMKKIASSEELPISSSSPSSSIVDHHHHHFYPSSSSEEEEEEEEDQEELRRPGQDEVWMSIQSGKQKEEKATSGWTWDSILTQKNGEEEQSKENQNQPPYIHPLVKRSTSSLSEKSLEICTESLGSETGSDGFSSYPPSEASDLDEEKQQSQQQQSYNNSMEEDLEIKFVKYNDNNNNNYSNRKIMQQQSRSFPPPLPSLAVREDGASLHMHCHRQNGRLVLEAVSVPSQNYFHAQRQDGRLLLTLISNPSSSTQDHDEMEEEETEEYTRVFDNIEEEEEEFPQDKDDEFEIEEEEEEEQMEEKFESKRSSEMEYYAPEQISRFPGAGGGGGVGLMNVHKSALVMKKVMSINNKNLTWSPNFNKAVNRMIGVEEEEEGEEDDDGELTAQIPQSLPPPPRMISTTAPPAGAASFNAYEYFWRQQKPSVANVIKQIPPSQPPSSTTATAQQSLKYKEMMNQNLPTAAGARNSKGYHYHHRHREQQKQNLVNFIGDGNNNNNNNAEYLVRRCNDSRKSLLLWGESYCIATS